MPVAQRVVDELEQITGGGGDADVAAAALCDALASLSGAGVLAGALCCFDGGPTDQHAALFGDPAAVHGGIGLVVFRGQPGPAG